ncbi:hypothetical protein MSAN_01509000 [Mycena sanguinolenta]|uniref:Uncharacterized protein n=1 Tax=Mycena sanguinolenta TaxID=230812 RepID=A0A8H6Y4N7_9AGAR|nr:hypothetical protein MSAN_01509000 [Mycena sanguinolenta]
MDLQPHSEAESALVSTTNTTGSDARYAGAFFPQASAFSIRGGAFTSNVTNNVYSHPSEQPSEFQTIRLGDMKLVNEVSFSPQFSVVGCQTRRVGVRRIYHAEIRRDPGMVTVAMYQGDGAGGGITEPLILLEAETNQNWNQSNVGELLPNSWVRFDSRRTPGLRRKLWTKTYELQKAWLAQANRIFTELEDKRCVENYVCVDYVHFSLRIADMGCIPEGYLFVCPAQHFRAGIAPHAHLYQWPACPAYWSLDPSGAVRLTTEDAGILGFPAIHTETVIGGDSWDGSVYQGLLRFHESKRFDPNSREVARQFGYPLFEVLSDLGSKVPFPARCVEKWRCEEEEDPVLCRELGHYL